MNATQLAPVVFDATGLSDPLYLPKWIASQIQGCKIDMAVDVSLLVAIACDTSQRNAREKIWPRTRVKGDVMLVRNRPYMSIRTFCTVVFPHLFPNKKASAPAQWRKFMEVHGRGALIQNTATAETIATCRDNLSTINDEAEMKFVQQEDACITKQVEDEVWNQAGDIESDAAGLIYIVTSPLLLAVKIGHWGGDVEALHYRYRTMYGQDLQMVYQAVDNRFVAEHQMHMVFASLRISNELFARDGWPEYERYIRAQNVSSFTLSERCNDRSLTQSFYQ